MVALAATSHAILDGSDLRNLGMSASATYRRVDRGRLFRIHRGVYSILPPELLKPEGRWLAAVKAVGANACLAWPDAGALWDLRRVPAGAVHVAVAGDGGRRRRTGIVVHRRRSLAPEEIVAHKGIPVTSPRRTLLDARHVLSPARFDSVLRKAEKLQLDTGSFYEVGQLGLNGLERRLFALCRRHSIPVPRAQQVIGPYTVDFLWPQARLVVETDGWADHGTRAGFEADRARDAWLLTQGYRVVRFTWNQICNEPAAVVGTLRALLGLAA